MATTATRGDIFNWVGTDRNGRPSQGEIQATSSAMAKAHLEDIIRNWPMDRRGDISSRATWPSLMAVGGAAASWAPG